MGLIMKTFEYMIKDALGIHARPAGQLVKMAKNYESNLTITKQGTSVDAKKLMALLSLGVINGTIVTIQAEGNDEDVAIKEIEQFFHENL